MSKDEFHRAKDRLMKSVKDEADSLSDPWMGGDAEEFYRRIAAELETLNERVWQIAQECRP